MKRLICLFLATLFITINIKGTYAQDYDQDLKKAVGKNYDQDLKKVIAKMKDLFEIDENFDKFTSRVNEFNGEVDFQLNWRDDKNFQSIDILVSNEGNVKKYYKSSKLKEEKNLSYEEALEKANFYIKKILNFKKADYRILENKRRENGIEYEFIFQRLIDGIPLKSNGWVVVSSNDGALLSFSQNFPDVEFPSTKNLIDEKEAMEIFKKELGLFRISEAFYDYDEGEAFFKTYFSEIYNEFSIDASNKELVQSNMDMYGRDMSSNIKEAGGTEEDFSPAEEQAISALKGMISKDEALKIAKKDFPIIKNLKLKNANFYQSSRGMLGETGIWQLNLSDDKAIYANVSVDAISKTVVSYNYGGQEFEGKEISYEDAREISEDLIKKLNPDKFSKIELDKHNKLRNNDDIFSFEFRRKTLGTYIADEGFRINLAKKSGTVVSYNLRWTDGQVPILKDGISNEEALEIFFKDNPLNLYGETFYDENGENLKGRFVWAPENRDLMISAKNGKLLSYNGKELPDPIEYSDVNGSRYEKAINGLKDMGYGYRMGKFEPEKPMSQFDFLYLVMSNYLDFNESINNRDELIKVALERDIIDQEELSLDKKFSLLDYSKYLIKRRNLEELAKRTEIFSKPYKNGEEIKEEDLGFINLAYAMNFIDKSEDGNMEAYKQLTRGEFAELFYRYLTK